MDMLIITIYRRVNSIYTKKMDDLTFNIIFYLNWNKETLFSPFVVG